MILLCCVISLTEEAGHPLAKDVGRPLLKVRSNLPHQPDKLPHPTLDQPSPVTNLLHPSPQIPTATACPIPSHILHLPLTPPPVTCSDQLPQPHQQPLLGLGVVGLEALALAARGVGVELRDQTA